MKVRMIIVHEEECGDIFRDTLANSCLTTLLLQQPPTEQVHNCKFGKPHTLLTEQILNTSHTYYTHLIYYTHSTLCTLCFSSIHKMAQIDLLSPEFRFYLHLISMSGDGAVVTPSLPLVRLCPWSDS